MASKNIKVSADIKKIQGSFYLFFRNMCPDFTVFDYQQFLIDKVQNEFLDPAQTHSRLMLSVPPGYGKSMLLAQLLPAFILGNNPDYKICLCSYSHLIANNLGKLCKQFMQTSTYKTIFPNVKITTTGESGSFSLASGGEIYCVGRGGSITSRRFDMIIADDLIKDSNEAQSEKIIGKLFPWFMSTLYSRFYKGKKSKLCIVATRWSQRDATGKCIEFFPDWPYYALDAIANENDILGRQIGQPLCEKLQTLAELMAIKEADPKSFSALYQNNPISIESCFISQMSIERSTNSEKLDSAILFPREKPITLISYDTATEVHSRADYTVATVFKVYKTSREINAISIVAIRRTKVDFNGLLNLFDELTTIYSPDYSIVEKASSGQQLLQMREKALPSAVFKNAKEKETWAKLIDYNLGKTLFVGQNVFNREIIEELTSFPFGLHDDSVLSLLHGYRYILENKSNLTPMQTKVKSNVITLLSRARNIETYKQTNKTGFYT